MIQDDDVQDGNDDIQDDNDTTYGHAVRRTVTVGVSLLAVATGTAAAHGGDTTGVGMMGGGSWGLVGGTMGVIGLLWMGLLLAVPLYLVYAVLGGHGARERAPGGDVELSLSALRERYARGELSDDEFERRRDRLERTG